GGGEEREARPFRERRTARAPEDRVDGTRVDVRGAKRSRRCFPREGERVFVGCADRDLPSAGASPRGTHVACRETKRRCRGADSQQSADRSSGHRCSIESAGGSVRKADSIVRSSGTLARSGGVAEWPRQRSAKPSTRVRFPPPPPAGTSAPTTATR